VGCLRPRKKKPIGWETTYLSTRPGTGAGPWSKYATGWSGPEGLGKRLSKKGGDNVKPVEGGGIGNTAKGSEEERFKIKNVP